MEDLVVGIGIALLLEGALYTLAPDGMRRLMAMALQQPVSRLRTTGLLLALIGLGVVALIRL